MPSVSPIKKSPVTKYLLDNKYYISKGEGSPFTKAGSLYFYGQNNEFLGEMTVHHKSYEIEVSKTIFEKKNETHLP